MNPDSTPPGSPIYQHRAHPHIPRNVNETQKAEQTGLNMRVAVWLTNHVGTMGCAYLFAALGIGSLIGVFTNDALLAALCGSLSSYFLQLVLLPVIQLGSNVLSRHAELQADETYATTQKTYHDIEQLAQHLSAQDDELLKLHALIESRLPAPPSAS